MRHKTSGYFLLSALLVGLVLGVCILLNLQLPQAASGSAMARACVKLPTRFFIIVHFFSYG